MSRPAWAFPIMGPGNGVAQRSCVARTHRAVGSAMLARGVLCAGGTSSNAAGLNQFIGFGDSTMDSGYFRYNPTGGSPGLPPGAPIDTIDRLIQATVAA